MSDPVKPIYLDETKMRARVMEHRFTRSSYGYTIRFWIESDPDHGGVSRKDAHDQINAALSVFDSKNCDNYLRLAAQLLDTLLCANSIEVCDGRGDGVAVHRDWP